VDDFVKHWQATLGSSAAATELLKQLPSLIKTHPTAADSAESSAQSTNAEMIQDVAAFKSKLKATEAPRPLVEWGDLPISRF